jgi:septation ring formation regulator EzrA
MIGVNQKLSKLDILDELNQRLSKIEKQCKIVDKDISEIKHQLQQQGGTTDMCLKQNSELYSRVEGIENENRWLKDENWKLREKGIESQTRSMRENLIIKGIPDVEHYREPENTEEKVKCFIGEVLEIKDDIKFHIAHRLKPRPDKKPRNIIAKFERRKDRKNLRKIINLWSMNNTPWKL